MSTATATMKGVFFSSKIDGLCEIRDLPIPTPGNDEVLIRNTAVASNPKDWKVPLWMPDWEGVEGNDVAGIVESVGKDVQEFKKGDKVAAFSKMRTDTKYGAYAEYTVAPAHTTWHLARSTAFEEASTLPLAMMTAAIGLFVRLQLSVPPESGDPAPPNGKVIIINGASSSVGAFAIQLAKKAGYAVVGIAGQSAEYATSLGADRVVDYRGKDNAALGSAVREAVTALTGNSTTGPVAVYDAVSTESTVEMLAYEVLDHYPSQHQGRKITTVLPAHDKGEGLHSKTGVQVERTMVGTAHSEDSEFAKKWYRIVGKWLDQGKFKANQVKLMPNGLDSVKEGVHLLKDNKVNAVKLVYRISDTRSLSQN